MKVTFWIFAANLALNAIFLVSNVATGGDWGRNVVPLLAWFCACISEAQLIQARK